MTYQNKPRHFQASSPAKTVIPATPVSVAFGDGIGPEIMNASLKVMLAAGANIAVEPIEIGEQVYHSGNTSGIAPHAWDSLRRTKVFFKAPITTPQGGGYKSLNVTIRKSLGLYANVRPCTSYRPFVASKHEKMDVVIIRENEEDLYAGIEHRQTEEVYQCLKLVSRPGCEKIVRYAFEYARAHGRKKVTCFSKDNIMKLTDGLLHKVFDEIAPDYPEIETDHWIIDIGAAKLADTPEEFDVIVTSNLYGDIISDIAAQIAGSVGLAPSANIGEHGAMFEAIHGSAPTIAGKNEANPSGLLLAGVMMLNHINQAEAAERIQNAWLRTIEDGIHTADIYTEDSSTSLVGTMEFADAVIQRLGQYPEKLPALKRQSGGMSFQVPSVSQFRQPQSERRLVGVDVFVQATLSPDALAEKMQKAGNHLFSLKMITNRGVKVWPNGMPETFCTDHWRCRFEASRDKQFNKAMLLELLSHLHYASIDFIKIENLYTYDNEPGYSLGQGQ